MWQGLQLSAHTFLGLLFEKGLGQSLPLDRPCIWTQRPSVRRIKSMFSSLNRFVALRGQTSSRVLNLGMTICQMGIRQRTISGKTIADT